MTAFGMAALRNGGPSEWRTLGMAALRNVGPTPYVENHVIKPDVKVQLYNFFIAHFGKSIRSILRLLCIYVALPRGP